MEIDLCGKIASGVDLIEHCQRRILRIAKIVFGVGEVDTFGKTFLVAAACDIYILSLVAVDYSCACILTERELSLGCHFGIAQHGKSHELVVFAGFGIVKYLSHHLVVLPAKHESVVVRGLTREHRESFGINDEHLVTVPILGLHIVGCQKIILRSVSRHWKHLLISEWFGCHNQISIYVIVYVDRI